MVTIINETRNMIRKQNQISPAAIELVKSERRIKYFYSKLCDAVTYFESVKQSISPEMIFLFKNHIKLVMQAFQAGSLSLTWTTVNIGMCEYLIHNSAIIIEKFNFVLIFKT